MAATGVQKPVDRKPAKPAPKKEPSIQVLWIPDDAVRAADADIHTLPESVRCYVRYIWLRDADQESIRRAGGALGQISRAPFVLLPYPVQGMHLVRVDLRDLSRSESDVEEIGRVWDEMDVDPAFSLLLTKDQLKFAAQLDPELLHRTVLVRRVRKEQVEAPDRVETIDIQHPGGDYVYPDGSGTVKNMAPGRYSVTLHWKRNGPTRVHVEEVEVPVAEALENADLVRLDPDHIDHAVFDNLRYAAHSKAPIAELEYFCKRALEQIQDEKESKLFAAVYGGLYYKLRGIRRSKVKGVTDQQLFFHDFLGFAVEDAPQNARALFDRLQSDQRSLLVVSDVTKKPRIGVFIAHAGAKFMRSGASFTLDVKDADIDRGQRSFANLLNPFFVASEGIFIAPNGMLVFVLFDGDGNLVDEVPSGQGGVADDTTVPPGYTHRLQPADSCISCHKEDGWKPFPNDVKLATSGRRGADVFGDLGAGIRDAFSPEVVNRLVGLYGGDLNTGLRRARDDFDEATLRCQGPRKESLDQTDSGRYFCNQVMDGRNRYWYAEVTARRALHDFGLEAPPGKELSLFNAVLPPGRGNGVYVPEDPTVAFMRAGVNVNRTDFALDYGFMETRAVRAMRDLGLRR